MSETTQGYLGLENERHNKPTSASKPYSITSARKPDPERQKGDLFERFNAKIFHRRPRTTKNSFLKSTSGKRGHELRTEFDGTDIAR